MRKFSIFYSWQSDLQGSKTRSFIRECIDKGIDLALDAETIEAKRDEATLDTTGSPNIVTTIFSKIDDCDLFIADISLCYTESCHGVKKSPNPNVLLELGYAVKTLGWERVICLCNNDFGNEYPFDIAHNRITGYSLENKGRNEEKSRLSEIIFKNIRDLRRLPPRAKTGHSTYILGTYDYLHKCVIQGISAIDLHGRESFILHNSELIERSKVLVDEIRYLKVGNTSDFGSSPDLDQEEDVTLAPLQKCLYGLDANSLFKSSPVSWTSINDDMRRISKWLGIDVEPSFFDLGCLMQSQSFLGANSKTYTGSEDEKHKHEKLFELSYNLLQLEVRENYLKTFDGMVFIPIALQNLSNVSDEEISISIYVETGEIVTPTENLIWAEYNGLQGLLCRDDENKDDIGIICELFCLEEDGNIHIAQESYSSQDYLPRIPVFTEFGLQQPAKSPADYLKELQEFIATPTGSDYYEFEVPTVRACECKWLSRGLLIKPKDDMVTLRYNVHSHCASEVINGTLTMNASV